MAFVSGFLLAVVLILLFAFGILSYLLGEWDGLWSFILLFLLNQIHGGWIFTVIAVALLLLFGSENARSGIWCYLALSLLVIIIALPTLFV